MENPTIIERHTPHETAIERVARESRDFGIGLLRLALLTLILTPFLLWAFLTADLPIYALDRFFSSNAAIAPSHWLTQGGLAIAFAPLVSILMARRFGGDEASRVITAAWTLAAIVVFFELSYLAPALDAGDLPSVRFTLGTVISAMAAQFIAVNIYDVARGGGRWWRAPFYGALWGYVISAALYFPFIYFGTGAPWLHWMVGDIAVKAVVAMGFLLVYGALRRPLRPRGGLGSS